VIYFWEYGHRMFGRFLGVAFTVPALYFSARGMVPRSLYPRLGLLFGLGGTQGLIGWWMVKSGLNVVRMRMRMRMRGPVFSGGDNDAFLALPLITPNRVS